MDYDYVVVGSGGAGLFAALLARRHGRVLVVTKDAATECNTRYAQGGIAAAIGADDSPELHYQDTLVAGAGLCDESAVRILAEEGPERVLDLIRMGLPFDQEDGHLALGREGAHGRARILHAGGDATGRQMELTLSAVAQQRGIEVRPHALVTGLKVHDGTVQGVHLLDLDTGEEQAVGARFVILATGGAGQLFTYTTNPTVATGDGIALAYRAGALVADLEFFQFHPTALNLPGAPSFLISEAVRGEGGILRTADGRAFMAGFDARADLAPRDIVARAIVGEMERTGRPVYLDVTHLPAERVRQRFPTITAVCLEHGLDMTREPVPVAPAAHYYMGGVVTDLWGETTIRNLFAAGECARSGVHGANRLASNSMLELVVFGHRVVKRSLVPAAERRPDQVHGLPVQWFDLSPSSSSGQRQGPRPAEIRPLLRRLLWQHAGIMRDAQRLQQAHQELASWQIDSPQTRGEHEDANMLLVARLLVEAALLREESRGAHARLDFPGADERWRRHLVTSGGGRNRGVVGERGRELAARGHG